MLEKHTLQRVYSRTKSRYCGSSYEKRIVTALVKRTSNDKIQGGRMWTFLSKLLPMTVNQHFKHPRFSWRRVQGKKDEEKESKYDGERVYIQDVNIFVKHFKKVDFRGENKYEKID